VAGREKRSKTTCYQAPWLSLGADCSWKPSDGRQKNEDGYTKRKGLFTIEPCDNKYTRLWRYTVSISRASGRRKEKESKVKRGKEQKSKEKQKKAKQSKAKQSKAKQIKAKQSKAKKRKEKLECL
jgi:hypothetical protein